MPFVTMNSVCAEQQLPQPGPARARHFLSSSCWQSQIKMVESYNPVAKYRLLGEHEMELTQAFVLSNRARTDSEAVSHRTISLDGVVYILAYSATSRCSTL